MLAVLDLVLGCGYGLLGWVIVSYWTGPAGVVLVVAVLAGVSVAGCRRWPWLGYATALAGQLIALAYMVSLSVGLEFALLATPPAAYALFQISARHRVRWSVAALPPLLACPIAALSMDGAIGPFFPIPLMLAPVMVIGHAERRHRQELVRHHAQLADMERDRSRLAVVEERIRIARELHDVIAHGMSVITIQAGCGHLVIDTEPEQARASLGAIETTSRQMLGEMRQMLGVLRADDDPPSVTPAPGLGAVEELVAQTGRAGVQVHLTVQGEAPQLPPGIDLAAYRIVQEALTNVVRHAQTDACRVRIEYGSAAVSLEIVDEGCGGPGGSAGLGLTGMRERAQLYGGRLEACPLPGRGFRVAAWLPLPATCPAEVGAVAVCGTGAPHPAESSR
ncbi:MAG TPA: sensor histidine kinase [Kineosporiaceae bacterium]|nr:sensor histidine kinase [Kineosporiaceae bacterium]